MENPPTQRSYSNRTSPVLPQEIDPDSFTNDHDLNYIPHASTIPNVHLKQNFKKFLPKQKFYRELKNGCYLLHFIPHRKHTFFPFPSYYGTMRIESKKRNYTASGDLYFHKNHCGKPLPPNPGRGIPIFPRKNYRYYLSVTKINSFGINIFLSFDRYKYNPSNHTWINEGEFHTKMFKKNAPAGFPNPSCYFEGDVTNERGHIIGQLNMGWISKYFRKATIEIDREQKSEFPEDNGNGIDWSKVYKKVGWKVNVRESNNNLAAGIGGQWSDAELHAAMLNQRDQSNLDTEWRYHLLCVQKLESTSRGIMYDAYGGDSNNIPREGAAIASHWIIPKENKWGRVKGVRFGNAPEPYFRTAIHELGHAMGLYHNSNNNGFMNTTDVIASNSGNTFPDNIIWNFNHEDAKRLKHMPDPWVRPGMIPYGNSSYLPFADDDDNENYANIEGLNLHVKSLLNLVPIGAPVRVELELTNGTNKNIKIPSSLSLKSEYVSGYVTDSFGKKRNFKSLFKCMDEHELGELKKGASKPHSLTLLRGAEGALFPTSGTHKIEVELKWKEEGVFYKVSGSTQVFISEPENEEHAEIALKVINTPDTLLSLAIGGDHLDQGNKVIQEALNNKILGPHYQVLEVKRLAKGFQKRKPNLTKASAILNKDSIASISEINRMRKILTPKAKNKPTASLDGKLKKIAQNRGFSDKTTQQIFDA